MGQKVHPYGFRLGIIRQSRSTWFAEGRRYREQLIGDIKIRRFIDEALSNASVSAVHIERAADTVTITIDTGKPGIIIGRGGRDVEVLRQRLEKLCGQKVRVNVEETKQPDIDATLVAQNIARQIERRVSYRRAMRQAIDRAMRLGAQGIRCKISGRLQGAEIARTEAMGPEGRVPLHTLRADVQYGLAEARTGYGHIGVKVWIYKGDILPPRRVKPSDLYVPEEEAVEEGAAAGEEEAVEEAPTAAAGEGEAEVEEAAAEALAEGEGEVQEAAPEALAEEQQPEEPTATPAEEQIESAPVEGAAAESEIAGDPQDTVIVAEAIEEGEGE